LGSLELLVQLDRYVWSSPGFVGLHQHIDKLVHLHTLRLPKLESFDLGCLHSLSLTELDLYPTRPFEWKREKLPNLKRLCLRSGGRAVHESSLPVLDSLTIDLYGCKLRDAAIEVELAQRAPRCPAISFATVDGWARNGQGQATPAQMLLILIEQLSEVDSMGVGRFDSSCQQRLVSLLETRSVHRLVVHGASYCKAPSDCSFLNALANSPPAARNVRRLVLREFCATEAAVLAVLRLHAAGMDVRLEQCCAMFSSQRFRGRMRDLFPGCAAVLRQLPDDHDKHVMHDKACRLSFRSRQGK
jgi:hypothetical protein